jgi:hypothetical protein
MHDTFLFTTCNTFLYYDVKSILDSAVAHWQRQLT